MCWTTSLLWYGNFYHGRRQAREEFSGLEPEIGVALGGGTDCTDRPQVAQLRLDDAVHLLGQVALTGRRAALEYVLDRLRPTDHDRARRVRGGTVRRHALALEELHLELEHAPHVVDGECRGDVVGQVVDDPGQRVVEVVERGRWLLRDARRLPRDEERGDADHHPHHQEPDDDRHGANVRTLERRPGSSGTAATAAP